LGSRAPFISAAIWLQPAGNSEELAVRLLICEWPTKESEPTKYWLSNLAADTPLARDRAPGEDALADRAGLPRA
jgi:hypothetical protein